MDPLSESQTVQLVGELYLLCFLLELLPLERNFHNFHNVTFEDALLLSSLGS